MSDTIPSTTLYRKQGRRYIPVQEGLDRYDLTVPVGGSVLVVATSPGGRTFRYKVTPDKAGFIAASVLFREAMVEAMIEAAKTTPRQTRKYTKKELACIERFREEMAQLGSFLPEWWEGSSPWKIAEAATKAIEAGKYPEPKF